MVVQAVTDLGLLRVFLREILGIRTLERSHHDIAKISAERWVEAMENGGAISGRSAAGYLFHSAQICRTIQGCRTVVDLGCGTGVQLLQVAKLNPDVDFIGVDRSLVMLREAAKKAAANAVKNVSFLFSDITELKAIASASVDGVLSTMTLHHIAGLGEVSLCFREISRILKPGGSVYIEDFGRMKSERSLKYFVSRGNSGDADSFSELYGASMRAAFAANELRTLAKASLPIDVRVFNTRPVPFLVVAKTPAHQCSPDQQRQLAAWFSRLEPTRKGDYRDLALAFRLGGLGEEIV
jgi:SAM-dependent methyltransferase